MGKLPRLSDLEGGLPALPQTANPYPLQNIIFDYPDNVDATHPLNLDYFIPVNCQQLVTARLSFKLRAYRTYSSFSVTATGGGTPHNHSIGGDATGSSGHSHNHAHALGIGTGAIGTGVFLFGGALTSTNAPPDAASGGDATNESGHSHNHSHGGGTGNEAVHTHTVSGSSFLGITESTVAAGVTVSFDGVAGTGALAGPFSSDRVDLDVTPFISAQIDNLWHVIALQPVGFGRITAILRLTYFSAVVQH